VGPFLTLPLAYVSGFGALITLLLLSSSPAYAEWVQVSNSDEAGKTRYVDPATIRPNRNLVKMWQFYDYKTVQTVGASGCSMSQTVWKRACGKE